jgi:hypothetical protein
MACGGEKGNDRLRGRVSRASRRGRFAAEVDQIFAVALKYGLPVDLHVMKSDAPDIRGFEYVLKRRYKRACRAA